MNKKAALFERLLSSCTPIYHALSIAAHAAFTIRRILSAFSKVSETECSISYICLRERSDPNTDKMQPEDCSQAYGSMIAHELHVRVHISPESIKTRIGSEWTLTLLTPMYGITEVVHVRHGVHVHVDCSLKLSIWNEKHIQRDSTYYIISTFVTSRRCCCHRSFSRKIRPINKTDETYMWYRPDPSTEATNLARIA
jgi:hypothetical protein